MARRLVRRMRLAERFLSDILNLPLHIIYDEACKLEHAMSEVVENRLAEVLGDPETCPHGYPIPSLEGRVSCPLMETATDLKAGDEAMVLTLPERNPDLLEYLVEQGLRPGVKFRVDEVAPFNGPMFLEIDGVRRALAKDALEEVRIQGLSPS